MIVAGLMSGTSLDGIDAAVVEITGKGWNKRVRTLAHSTTPYPAKVRQALLGVSNTNTHTAEIAWLNFLLPELYAKAVQRLCAKSGIRNLQLAGCHGQTIFHRGGKNRCTLQIGDGSVLAERLGVPVVSDFRPRDMAAGGQGAPLVPYVDYLLLRDRKRGRIALNIGGIANITAIAPGAGAGEVFAFDTGPGNMVMDALAQEYSSRLRYDRNGAIARSGQINQQLLKTLLRDPFYRRNPPKSAGREQFGKEFIAKLHQSGLPLQDLMATATALTASTIAGAIRQQVQAPMHDLIAAGGGVHNSFLMQLLAAELPQLRVQSISAFGIDPDAKEAIAFAVLAHETFTGQPSNMPRATGARHPVILGKISPGPAA